MEDIEKQVENELIYLKKYVNKQADKIKELEKENKDPLKTEEKKLDSKLNEKIEKLRKIKKKLMKKFHSVLAIGYLSLRNGNYSFSTKCLSPRVQVGINLSLPKMRASYLLNVFKLFLRNLEINPNRSIPIQVISKYSYLIIKPLYPSSQPFAHPILNLFFYNSSSK